MIRDYEAHHDPLRIPQGRLFPGPQKIPMIDSPLFNVSTPPQLAPRVVVVFRLLSVAPVVLPPPMEKSVFFYLFVQPLTH